MPEELEEFTSKLRQAAVNYMDTSKHFGCWVKRVKMKQKIDVGVMISFGTMEFDIWPPRLNPLWGTPYIPFMIGYLAQLTASS